jgi:hypothetical protein
MTERRLCLGETAEEYLRALATRALASTLQVFLVHTTNRKSTSFEQFKKKLSKSWSLVPVVPSDFVLCKFRIDINRTKGLRNWIAVIHII